MDRPLLLVALIALTAVAAAFLPDPHAAAAGEDVTITIEPLAPTELDVVSITVAGGSGFCTASSSHTLSDNTIVIVLQEEADGCVAIPLPFSVTEEIGLLPAGSYQVVACCFTTGFFKVGAAFGVTAVAVGGIAELPDVAGTAPLQAGDSSTASVRLLATAGVITAGVIALGGTAWYARRRWAR